MKYVELNYNEWEKQFGPPIANPLRGDGLRATFETYGEELAYVQDVYDNGKFGVWTLMEDGNGGICISEGMAFVNRLAYLITERPYPADTFFYIKDN